MSRTQVSKKFWLDNNGAFEMHEGVVSNQLEPGVYEMVVIESPFGNKLFLKHMKVNTDNIAHLPDSLCDYLLTMVQGFWESRDRYSNMGLLHKRGILLEGMPGTGKTIVCLALGAALQKHGGITVLTTPMSPTRMLSKVLLDIRDTHPNAPIVNIMEDIDQQDIDSILPLLDGEHGLGNVVHLATTNFVSDLDARVTNRPSRFDEVINVTCPSEKARLAYLESVIPADGQKRLKTLAKISKDLNFAQLKELAICTYIYNRDPQETVDRLREMEWQAEEYERIAATEMITIPMMGDKVRRRILTAKKPAKLTKAPPTATPTATAAALTAMRMSIGESSSK